MSDPQVGFVTMAGPKAQGTAPSVGVGMLGYAFMGKAHSNALRKLPYMMYPPVAIPEIVLDPNEGNTWGLMVAVLASAVHGTGLLFATMLAGRPSWIVLAGWVDPSIGHTRAPSSRTSYEPRRYPAPTSIDVNGSASAVFRLLRYRLPV